MVFATLEYIFVSWEAIYMKGFCQVISCEETHAQGNIHVSLGNMNISLEALQPQTTSTTKGNKQNYMNTNINTKSDKNHKCKQ